MKFWSGVHKRDGIRPNYPLPQDGLRWPRLSLVLVCEFSQTRIPWVNAIIFPSGNCQEISWAVLQATARGVHSAVRQVPAARILLHVGEWLSLVEHLVRDQGVGGSNPLSPTIYPK
jgi:hypothetical protein